MIPLAISLVRLLSKSRTIHCIETPLGTIFLSLNYKPISLTLVIVKLFLEEPLIHSTELTI